MLTFYEMDTFVATCRTTNGALELAQFLECKFPFYRRFKGDQLHKFVVTVELDGKIEVHSTVPVNDLGREDFKKYITEFLEKKGVPAKKPVERASAIPSRVRIAA